MLKKIIVAFLLLFPFSISVNQVSAVYLTHQNSYISKNRTINDDVLIASDHVTIEGTINGNVYVAGGTVVVNGKVNGAVFATGKNVEIGGFVRDNLVVAGGRVSVDTETSTNGGIIIGSRKIK